MAAGVTHISLLLLLAQHQAAGAPPQTRWYRAAVWMNCANCWLGHILISHTHTRMIQHCDVSSSSLIFNKIYPDNQFWCVCVCVYVETASDWCYMTRSDIFGMGLCIKVNIRRNRMQWLSIDPFWISSDPMVSLERYTSWYFTVDNVLSKILAPYFTVIYAKANTVGGMGCVKPDAPSTQEPTGHC